MSRLRGRRCRRVPSLASLLEVALVPGSLGEHLHPALLVLLQASPELRTLPLSLHLPGEVEGRQTMLRENIIEYTSVASVSKGLYAQESSV